LTNFQLKHCLISGNVWPLQELIGRSTVNLPSSSCNSRHFKMFPLKVFKISCLFQTKQNQQLFLFIILKLHPPRRGIPETPLTSEASPRYSAHALWYGHFLFQRFLCYIPVTDFVNHPVLDCHLVKNVTQSIDQMENIT